MQNFRYARKTTRSVHNFDACQIYVSEMTDLKGRLYPGIVSLWAGGISVEVPHPLTTQKARQFAAELRHAACGRLPAKIRVRGQFINYFSGLWFFFRESAESAGQTYLVGNMVMGSVLGQARKNVSVNLTTVIECAASIEALYRDEPYP